MPGRKQLIEASNLYTNDGDFSLSPDGLLLIGRTPDGSVALHAAMENPVFPFTLAHWFKSSSSLVINFSATQVNRDAVRSILQDHAPWLE